MLNFPLMLVPLVLYNLFAFDILSTYMSADWQTILFQLSMPSGSVWQFTLGELFISSTLFLLFIELLKATRRGGIGLWEHLLSFMVLIAFVAEFIFVKQAATTLFFILTCIAIIDVITSFVISRQAANYDLDGDEAFEL